MVLQSRAVIHVRMRQQECIDKQTSVAVTVKRFAKLCSNIRHILIFVISRGTNIYVYENITATLCFD